MKVQHITLKEVDFVEIDGEFHRTYKNEKKYPVFLTNRAIKYGYENGFLETSLYSDLLKMSKQAPTLQKADDEATLNFVDDLDQQKMLGVIYLAFRGANPNEKLTQDDFLDLYHAETVEILTVYMGLIAELIGGGGENAFTKALASETKKDGKK